MSAHRIDQDGFRRLLAIARRRVGIRKWERRCRLTRFRGRMVAAWRVPGTSESGEHHRLQLDVAAELDRLLKINGDS